MTLTPVGKASCGITDGAPHIQVTITGSEAGPGAESFYVDEYAPGAETQVVITVPGPLTDGEVVTATGPVNPAALTCAVGAASGNGS